MLASVRTLAAMMALLIANPASAAVVAYTDFSAWQTAVSGNGSITTEDFNGPASSFSANSSGNVIGAQTTVALDGGFLDAGPTGLTGNGYFRGEVDSSSKFLSDGLGLDFSFATAVGGFALNDFRSIDFGKGKGLMLQEIGIVVAGQSYLLSDLLGLTDSTDGRNVKKEKAKGPVFLGFASDTDLSGFSLIHGDFVAAGYVSGNNEEFMIGSLSLASPAPSTVPVPAALPMLMAGLGVFGVIGWRRQSFRAS